MLISSSFVLNSRILRMYPKRSLSLLESTENIEPQVQNRFLIQYASSLTHLLASALLFILSTKKLHSQTVEVGISANSKCFSILYFRKYLVSNTLIQCWGGFICCAQHFIVLVNQRFRTTFSNPRIWITKFWRAQFEHYGNENQCRDLLRPNKWVEGLENCTRQ